MLHDDLVARAVRWLRTTRRCCPILTGLKGAREEPDAIGWKTTGLSVLVECKASRADFFRDAKKLTRRFSDVFAGMGQERWYMTRTGLIAPHEVPAGWGLIEVKAKVTRIIVRATCPRLEPQRSFAELPLLLMALRRYQLEPLIDGRMPLTIKQKEALRVV